MVDETKEEGFEVIDEVEIGDLSGVKEQRNLIPAAKGVKFLIKKAEPKDNPDKTYRQINLQLQLVDGIPTPQTESAYKGMTVFGRVCYYADPSVYTKDFFKNKQHLVELKRLLDTVEVTDRTKVNDQLFSDLKGKLVMGDILQKAGKPYTNAEGDEVMGEPQNEVVRFRAVPLEEQV